MNFVSRRLCDLGSFRYWQCDIFDGLRFKRLAGQRILKACLECDKCQLRRSLPWAIEGEVVGAQAGVPVGFHLFGGEGPAANAAGLSGRGGEFEGFKCERARGGDDFAIAAVHADLNAETGDAFAVAKVIMPFTP